MKKRNSTVVRLSSLKPYTMANGNLAVDLTEAITWEHFPEFANRFVERYDGKVKLKNTTVDMHLWEITINSALFQLVYEDFPGRVCLESQDAHGNNVLRELINSMEGITLGGD